MFLFVMALVSIALALFAGIWFYVSHPDAVKWLRLNLSILAAILGLVTPSATVAVAEVLRSGICTVAGASIYSRRNAGDAVPEAPWICSDWSSHWRYLLHR